MPLSASCSAQTPAEKHGACLLHYVTKPLIPRRLLDRRLLFGRLPHRNCIPASLCRFRLRSERIGGSSMRLGQRESFSNTNTCEAEPLSELPAKPPYIAPKIISQFEIVPLRFSQFGDLSPRHSAKKKPEASPFGQKQNWRKSTASSL